MEKQGNLYKIEILTKKYKGRNKKSEKDESTLKSQVKKMKMRIMYL